MNFCFVYKFILFITQNMALFIKKTRPWKLYGKKSLFIVGIVSNP
jgi:hypothetical protein